MNYFTSRFLIFASSAAEKGRSNGSRIAEVALLFRRLFGQDVTVISVFALDLSCAGERKTLLCSGIGFHFRHVGNS
mgnify:CR=1 FL=1